MGNRDRKRSWLEKRFFPRDLRKYINSPESKRTDPLEDQDDCFKASGLQKNCNVPEGPFQAELEGVNTDMQGIRRPSVGELSVLAQALEDSPPAPHLSLLE